VITDDPLKFKFGNVNFQVDLEAEKIVAAERAGEKIAVEVKSFLNPSAIGHKTQKMAELRSAIFWVLNCPIYLLRCYTKHFFSLNLPKLLYNVIRSC